MKEHIVLMISVVNQKEIHWRDKIKNASRNEGKKPLFSCEENAFQRIKMTPLKREIEGRKAAMTKKASRFLFSLAIRGKRN